jgi:pyruvate kinase
MQNPNGIPIFTFTNNKNTLKQMSLVGSSICFYIPRLNNHEVTLSKAEKVLKNYFKEKKSLKFIMLSGIFSEEHSEAMQIINF